MKFHSAAVSSLAIMASCLHSVAGANMSLRGSRILGDTGTSTESPTGTPTENSTTKQIMPLLENASQLKNSTLTPIMSLDTVASIVSAVNAGESVEDHDISAAKYGIQNDDSELLQGFSIQSHGTGNSPFEDILDCKGDDDQNACRQTVQSPESFTHYESTLSSSSTRSTFMKTMVSAEGGTLGFHASASASYMQSSAMSQTSVSHIIGGSGPVHELNVRNKSKLKLKDFAKKMLLNDPATFISTYGMNFVSSVTYGGNFLGSFDMNADSASSQTELDVEASFKYSEGFFSIGGSAEFQQRKGSSDSNLQITNNFKALPKPNVTLGSIDTPIDMDYLYGNWSETIVKNPAPIFLYVNGWSGSDDVMEVITSPHFPKEYYNVFAGHSNSISPTTIEIASEERINTGLLQKAVQNYLTWPSIKDSVSSDTYQKLKNLHDKTNTYLTWYTSDFNDASIFQLQNQIKYPGNTTVEEDIPNPFHSWTYYSEDGGLADQFDAITLYYCKQSVDNHQKGDNAICDNHGNCNNYCPASQVCDSTAVSETVDIDSFCKTTYHCMTPNTKYSRGNNKICNQDDNDCFYCHANWACTTPTDFYSSSTDDLCHLSQ